jgi:hypothetical protein
MRSRKAEETAGAGAGAVAEVAPLNDKRRDRAISDAFEPCELPREVRLPRLEVAAVVVAVVVREVRTPPGADDEAEAETETETDDEFRLLQAAVGLINPVPRSLPGCFEVFSVPGCEAGVRPYVFAAVEVGGDSATITFERENRVVFTPFSFSSEEAVGFETVFDRAGTAEAVFNGTRRRMNGPDTTTSSSLRSSRCRTWSSAGIADARALEGETVGAGAEEDDTWIEIPLS